MEKCLQDLIKDMVNQANQQKSLELQSMVPNKFDCSGSIVTRTSGIVGGLEIAKEVFKQINTNIKILIFKKDGTFVNRGDAILSFKGNMADILKVQGIVLSIINYASGLSTVVDKYISELKDLDTIIYLSHKNATVLSAIDEDVASKIGAFYTDEYKTITINDTYINLNGSIAECVKLCQKKNPNVDIEIEVKSLEEYEEAKIFNPKYITLINMKINDIETAMNSKGNFLIGYYGGITIAKARSIAKLGFDYLKVDNANNNLKSLECSFKVYKRYLNK